MLKVTVIGSGNVARHLISVLQSAAGVNLVQAFARRPDLLSDILPSQQIVSDYRDLAQADIYIIAVTDDAITEVSSSLPFSNRLVVHTSGSVAMEELDDKNRKGVFYPLQTFSRNKTINFHEVPLCLEASNENDFKLIQQLALLVSENVYAINSLQRQSLHVAAVFVSNFVNHMYTLGSKICEERSVPFNILKPLIRETADKVQHLLPAEAQTGPAKRNDKGTMQKHEVFLEDENLKNIYRLLSRSIQNTK